MGRGGCRESALLRRRELANPQALHPKRRDEGRLVTQQALCRLGEGDGHRKRHEGTGVQVARGRAWEQTGSKKKTVPAFTKNSTKILSLKVHFQMCFKLSQKDFMLLEELITVSSTAGTLPSSKVTHTHTQKKSN